MGNAVKAAVVNVLKAWRDPGINPDYHNRKKEQLRREWPMLYHALSTLSASAAKSKYFRE